MAEPDLCTFLQDCQKLKTVRWTGAWKLPPRRAMSLLPRKSSQLLIVQGCAWITWGGPLLPGATRGGDIFLETGQIIDVPAGAHLVMQSRHAAEGLHFDWREMPAGLAEYLPARAVLPELAQQWGLAWAQLGRASARLLLGVWHLVRGVGRSPRTDQLPV